MTVKKTSDIAKEVEKVEDEKALADCLKTALESKLHFSYAVWPSRHCSNCSKTIPGFQPPFDILLCADAPPPLPKDDLIKYWEWVKGREVSAYGVCDKWELKRRPPDE